MKLVLIGFMGSGKTSISKILAKELDLLLIDMDRAIIDKSGRESDREIFDLDGEKRFRELESEVAKTIEDASNSIISTGGGIIMNEENMNYLKKNALIIYLNCSFATAKNRISPNNPKPLFRDLDKARELYLLRQPLYSKYANIIVETDFRKPIEIAKEIINKINSYENNS